MNELPIKQAFTDSYYLPCTVQEDVEIWEKVFVRLFVFKAFTSRTSYLRLRGTTGGYTGGHLKLPCHVSVLSILTLVQSEQRSLEGSLNNTSKF